MQIVVMHDFFIKISKRSLAFENTTEAARSQDDLQSKCR